MTIACLLLNTLRAACAQPDCRRRQFDDERDCRYGRRLTDTASALPGVGDLIERLGAEPLRRARDRAAAERAVEFDRRLVVGQRPDHEALQPALREIALRAAVNRRRPKPSPWNSGRR